MAAQDIRYFFKILPTGYINELDKSAKDSLLRGKPFYPASNDSDMIEVYKLVEVDTVKNFLRIESRYESGQAGFLTTEIRGFKTEKDNWIVILSQVGGAHNMFDQNNLIVLSYSKDKGLTETKPLGLVRNVSIRNFIKSNTPTPVIRKYEGYSSIAYELGYTRENITLQLTENFDLGKLDKKWLLGDMVEFIWTGTQFVQLKPRFHGQ